MRLPFRSGASPAAGLRSLLALAAAGSAVLLYCVFRDPAQAFPGLLTASMFGTGLALGAAVFIAIQGTSGARWWAPLSPVSAALAGTFPVSGLAVLATLVLGLKTLYPFARPGAVAESEVLRAKAAWLNPPFVLARAVLVVVIWTILIRALRRRLAALTERPSEQTRRAFTRTSVAFLLLLAPTLSVASWDWLMSLEPSWYSTMFSVYVFSGTFLAGIAVVTLASVWLDARGRLTVPLAPETRHDLGKLLFAFGTFWAYIWFSQYLLIWYTNLPAETPYYARRLSSGWTLLFWLNPVLNFGVPFLALLSAGVKRRPAVLAQVALLVLLGRWLDGYLLVAPASGPLPVFPTEAVVATLLLTAAVVARFARLRESAPVPSRSASIAERLPVLPPA